MTRILSAKGTNRINHPADPYGVWIDPRCGCDRSPDVATSEPCPTHGNAPRVPVTGYRVRYRQGGRTRARALASAPLAWVAALVGRVVGTLARLVIRAGL